eukprot:Opistho-2@15339
MLTSMYADMAPPAAASGQNVGAPSKSENFKMSLSEILEVYGTPLTEPQLWAVCFQVAMKLAKCVGAYSADIESDSFASVAPSDSAERTSDAAESPATNHAESELSSSGAEVQEDGAVDCGDSSDASLVVAVADAAAGGSVSVDGCADESTDSLSQLGQNGASLGMGKSQSVGSIGSRRSLGRVLSLGESFSGELEREAITFVHTGEGEADDGRKPSAYTAEKLPVILTLDTVFLDYNGLVSFNDSILQTDEMVSLNEHFMAPEKIKANAALKSGKFADAPDALDTEKVHVYSLGATLWRAADFTLSEDEEPCISDQLEELIAKMVEDDPTERYGLRRVLAECLQHGLTAGDRNARLLVNVHGGGGGGGAGGKNAIPEEDSVDAHAMPTLPPSLASAVEGASAVETSVCARKLVRGCREMVRDVRNTRNFLDQWRGRSGSRPGGWGDNRARMMRRLGEHGVVTDNGRRQSGAYYAGAESKTSALPQGIIDIIMKEVRSRPVLKRVPEPRAQPLRQTAVGSPAVTPAKPKLDRNRTRLELPPELVTMGDWDKERLMYELGLADEPAPLRTPSSTPNTSNYNSPATTPAIVDGEGEGSPSMRPPRRRSSTKTILKLDSCLLEDDVHGAIAVTETPGGNYCGKAGRVLEWLYNSVCERGRKTGTPIGRISDGRQR